MPTNLKCLTTREVSELLGVHYRTVLRWRVEERGPAFVRVMDRVRYFESEIERFLMEGDEA